MKEELFSSSAFVYVHLQASCFMCRYLFLFLLPMSLLSQPQTSIRVMSFNLRLNTAGDKDNAWPHRKGLARSMIRFHQADLIGVQEALEDQMSDLSQMLLDFASHGVARDTGKGAEYSAIWYRKSRFDLLEGSTFWLSESPKIPGKGWDAALNRIVSWAKFHDRWTGRIFFHFNTHFDHRGETARKESARLILRQIQKLNPTQLPVLLTGDFNATPSSQPYQILTQSPELPSVKDSWTHSMEFAHGPASTWSGFKEAGVPDRRIDYVFYQNQVSVLRCASLSDSWSGRFPSDHLPVLAEVLIAPVQALPQAHAHNDYEHERPLLDALDHGFTSIEVDAWLMNGELYVSHNRPSSLEADKTLRHLYLDPLARRISQGIGQIYPGSAAPFYLMIDIKNEGKASYTILQEQLKEYRWMLASPSKPANGIHIFLSGARPVQLIREDASRCVGIDGRPEHLGQGFTVEQMPVISQQYGKILSWRGQGKIPKKDLQKLRTLVQAAHAEGKKVRLWASPEKENVWTTLLEAGVDFLNTDELSHLQGFLQRNQSKSAK
ncbi:MAG: endonuclease/exonuclease/phosphatase family protein [Bacteroidota bacterium]